MIQLHMPLLSSTRNQKYYVKARPCCSFHPCAPRLHLSPNSSRLIVGINLLFLFQPTQQHCIPLGIPYCPLYLLSSWTPLLFVISSDALHLAFFASPAKRRSPRKTYGVTYSVITKITSKPCPQPTYALSWMP